ncbi:MAG: hypothetical protein B6244_13115 [Candidatus Cloacimonetes bacterium 4572_55]|nr:MAG: hypothetical protein B6244_13115 [Candidatus Cloacimonetes bacterium 4572_55]
MRLIFYYLISITFFIASGCASSNKTISKSEKSSEVSDIQNPYEKLAIEKYHGGIDYQFNKSKTYVLCIKKPATPKPFMPLYLLKLRFFIQIGNLCDIPTGVRSADYANQ